MNDIFKTVQERLVNALLEDTKSTIEKKYGKALYENGYIKNVGTHQYLFKIKRCARCRSGYSSLVLALNPKSALAHGWMEFDEMHEGR